MILRTYVVRGWTFIKNIAYDENLLNLGQRDASEDATTRAKTRRRRRGATWSRQGVKRQTSDVREEIAFKNQEGNLGKARSSTHSLSFQQTQPTCPLNLLFSFAD